MKKKLEVTPAEMLELRAQGMSNHDIAKSLDISMSAVYRYIGSQGVRMERMQAFADDKPVKPKPKAEPTPAYQPDVISATYRISDEIIAEIEHNPTRITLERGDGAITITADEAATLTQFLVWASNSARKE